MIIACAVLLLIQFEDSFSSPREKMVNEQIATISQPFVVAWMTALLKPAAAHRVLEIGTGSGYQSAVLSSLAHWVYTMEIRVDFSSSKALNN